MADLTPARMTGTPPASEVHADVRIHPRSSSEPLIDSAEQLRGVIEASPNGIVLADAQGIIRLVNPQVERTLGYSRGDLLGRPVEILVPQATREAHRSWRGDYLRHPEVRPMGAGRDLHALTRDGSELPVEIGLTPIRMPDGPGVLVTIVDISERKRHEQALRESEARFRAFTSTISDVVFRVSPDWSVMRHLAGREFIADTHEPSGRWMDEYIHPDDQVRFSEEIARAVAARSPLQLEHRVIRLDGVVGWAETRAIPILDADGDVVEWFGTVTDVTSRMLADEALRRSEEQLRMAKDAAGIGIHDFDPVSGAIHWDERVRELWGVAPGETVTYELFMAAIHPDDRAGTQAAVDRALDPNGPGEYRAEFRVTCRIDGLTRWVAVSGRVTFETGRAVRLVGTVQDITERKVAEAELRSALASKDQFLGFVSHELRTPMTVILGMSRLLAKGNLPEGTVRELAADIASSGERLDDLIDSLLLLARADGGEALRDVDPTLLHRLVEDVLRRQRERDPSRDYVLEVQTTETLVDVEDTWLERVILNLLGNSAKYSAPGAPVTVILDRLDSDVRVRVLDEGEALDTAELEQVFEPFFRGSAHSGETPGAGLGLAVSRRIMESLGGRIWVQPRPGGGAEFGIAIPLLTADEESREVGTPGEAPSAGG